MSRRYPRQEILQILEIREENLLALETESIVQCDAGGEYSDAALERLRVSKTLMQDLGVNVEGVAIVLQLREQLESERRLFQHALDFLKRHLA